jgi:hypothetical protein
MLPFYVEGGFPTTCGRCTETRAPRPTTREFASGGELQLESIGLVERVMQSILQYLTRFLLCHIGDEMSTNVLLDPNMNIVAENLSNERNTGRGRATIVRLDQRCPLYV